MRMHELRDIPVELILHLKYVECEEFQWQLILQDQTNFSDFYEPGHQGQEGVFL